MALPVRLTRALTHPADGMWREQGMPGNVRADAFRLPHGLVKRDDPLGDHLRRGSCRSGSGFTERCVFASKAAYRLVQARSACARPCRAHACRGAGQRGWRGPSLPLYVMEPELWAEPDYSGRHYVFLRECLNDLRDRLARLGQPLVIRTGPVHGHPREPEQPPWHRRALLPRGDGQRLDFPAGQGGCHLVPRAWPAPGTNCVRTG